MGGASGDEIYGHGGDDTFDGGTGADLLFGGAGDDTIRGGKGDDRIEGGAGVDTLTGGRGADTFVLDKDGDVDIITDFEFGVDRIEVRSDLAGGLAGDTPAVAMSIGGALHVATIVDALGLPTELNIMLGKLTMARLPNGLDALSDYFQKVEAGKGTVTLGTEKGDAIDAKRGSPTFGLSGVDVIGGTRRSDLIFGNGDPDELQGKGGPDILIGGAGDNTLYGGGGNDLLVGDEDVDLILGGPGRDTLIGGAGHDRLAGGAGRDVFVISNNSLDSRPDPDTVRDFEIGKDRIDLSGLRDKSDALTLSDIGLVKHAGKHWLTTPSTIDSAGHDRMARINFSDEGAKLEELREKFLVAEHFIFKGGYGALVSGRDAAKLLGTKSGDLIMGNGLANTISGGKGADTLLGGASGDTLKGGPGKDVLSGGVGDDRLEGGGGDDILEGGEGDDRLIGGPGDDKLIGGPGDDRLTGGPGADEFHFSALRTVINTNRITDFEPGVDKIVIDEDIRDDLVFTIADGEVTISGKGLDGIESTITFDYLEAMDLLLRGVTVPDDL
ncbi:M10 family metallopeptidase C-terminal domain-containing protein [Antarcticimicrobium luteum]|uniref:calcium-binding protein n=1 Tax=Antarcticimicrobium luteum TaxID=2547397 RepID=UPI0014072D08